MSIATQAKNVVLLEVILAEWESCLHSLEICAEGMENDPDDTDWPLIDDGAQDRTITVKRIADAAGIELPNEPDWLKGALEDADD